MAMSPLRILICCSACGCVWRLLSLQSSGIEKHENPQTWNNDSDDDAPTGIMLAAAALVMMAMVRICDACCCMGLSDEGN